MDIDDSASDGEIIDRLDGFPDALPVVARAVLREAAQQLTERGLMSAAKWALELLVHVPKVSTQSNGTPQRRRGSPVAALSGDGVGSSAQAGPSSLPMQYSTPAAPTKRQRRPARASEYSPQPSEGTEQHVYPYQSTPAMHAERGQTPSFMEDSATGEPVHLPPTHLAAVQTHRGEMNGHDTSLLSPGPRGTTESTPASAHVHFASTQPSASSSAMMDDDRQSNHAEGSNWHSRGLHGGPQDMDDEEYDTYMLAKSLFDHHQWERCARLLEKHDVQSDTAVFLKVYARYLIVERKAEEDYFQASKWVKGKHAPRSALVPLLRDLIDPQDPFLLFLKGVIFKKLDKRIEAIDCFIRSLELFPYNWSAWQELCTSLEGGQAELQDLMPMLPDSFMTSFFLELFARSSSSRMINDDSLKRIDVLLDIFPDSPYLLVCRGQVLHLLMRLIASEQAYEAARAVDPLRLEGMADYSNSLFVQNKEEKLAHLTHELAEAGREDADVCCAVGNYYTLRGQNDRAVEVFKRAVRLDPSCSSAWILLGHGYIELKDSLAAAEMYRKALKLNPRDVRAWTGLGNTYELNSAWAQALHYHKKAAANSPYDYRFWASMSNCYEQLGQLPNAIECYKRILILEDGIDLQLLMMDDIARAYELMASMAAEQEEEEEEDESQATTLNGDKSGTPRMQHMMRACSWHKRIAELIDTTHFDDGSDQAARIQKHVASFLVAARWEIELAEKEAGFDDSSAMAFEQANELAPGAVSSSSAPSYAAISQSLVMAQRDEHVARAQHYLSRIMLTGTEAILQAEELQKKLALVQT